MKRAGQFVFGAILAFLLLFASVSLSFDHVWKALVAFFLVMCLPRQRRVLVTYCRVPLCTASAILLSLAVISAFVHARIPVSTTQAIGLEDYHMYYLIDLGPVWPRTLPTWQYEIKPTLEFQWAGSPFQNYVFQTGGMTSSGTWTERIILSPLEVFLLLLLPTLVIWLFRPSSAPGECGRCRYDLTGNISGVCPECGKRIESAPGQMAVAERVMREDCDVLRKLGQ